GDPGLHAHAGAGQGIERGAQPGAGLGVARHHHRAPSGAAENEPGLGQRRRDHDRLGPRQVALEPTHARIVAEIGKGHRRLGHQGALIPLRVCGRRERHESGEDAYRSRQRMAHASPLDSTWQQYTFPWSSARRPRGDAPSAAMRQGSRMQPTAMNASSQVAPRRPGVTVVHSIDRFVFTVPDLDAAQRFYAEFGLDARREGERVDLYAHGHPHRWASIHAAPGPKRFQYLRFGVYADDFAPLLARLDGLGIARRAPHALGEEGGAWLADPDGNVLQVVVADKVSASVPGPAADPPAPPPGQGAAPARSRAGRVRPRQLSHVLLFSSDVARSVGFYEQALGLRLSDRSGDVI